MTTPENYPLIVAVMQVPKQTKREREQITMLLAPHTTFEDVTECLLGEPMNILEIMSLSGTDSRKTRHELELSYDRLAYAMHVASYLENIAKDLRNIEPISEHNLYSLGVILQRLPRVVTEESWFSYTSERKITVSSPRIWNTAKKMKKRWTGTQYHPATYTQKTWTGKTSTTTTDLKETSCPSGSSSRS